MFMCGTADCPVWPRLSEMRTSTWLDALAHRVGKKATRQPPYVRIPRSMPHAPRDFGFEPCVGSDRKAPIPAVGSTDVTDRKP